MKKAFFECLQSIHIQSKKQLDLLLPSFLTNFDIQKGIWFYSDFNTWLTK